MSQKHETAPLKLVNFERYMLADDCPDYPMVIAVKATLKGQLNRAAFESAFEKVLENNPLLTSKISQRLDDYYWTPTNPIAIVWTNSAPKMIRLNLAEDPGIKAFANCGEDSCELTLFIHHSVADAKGICQLLEDWLNYYGIFAGGNGKASAVQKLDQERHRSNLYLPHRGRFGMNLFKYLLRPFQELCGVVGLIEYFSHRPVAIGPQSVQHNPDSESLTHDQTTLKFSVDETQQVFSDSKSTRYKINDMMVASMYTACHHWLEIHQPEQCHRHQRIVIPIDMRSKTTPEKCIANHVSMVFLDRRPARHLSVRNLCWSIWLEMTAIKAMRLGLTLIHLISFYRVRKNISGLFPRNRSVATTILSNMGQLFPRSPLRNRDAQLECHGLTLTELNLFPPIRPYTWISCLVHTYGNQIRISANWCSESLKPQDVLEILAKFKQTLLTGFANPPSESQTLSSIHTAHHSPQKCP
ncbi:MAG: hypothetical protein VX438_19485 [Planctomycetota bacterium]|nr:hypothetical protein [Planctomycetota bacterium]